MFKEQKGITLVALVITIIVLLILAGVSISLVMGQNGVLGRAGQAVDATTLGTIRDEINNALASVQTDYYSDMATGSGVSLASTFEKAGKCMVLTGSGDSQQLTMSTTDQPYGKFISQFNDKVLVTVTKLTTVAGTDVQYRINYTTQPLSSTDKKEYHCVITVSGRSITITTDVTSGTGSTTTNT